MTSPLDEAVERVRDAFERTDEEGFSPEIEQVFVDYLPTILNALSPDEERGWQPIETAPKDGDDILVEWNDGGTMLVVSWDEKAERWATLDGLSYHPDAFKAWRTLPAPSDLAMSNASRGG